jgi:hypothetical protein
MSDLHAAPVEDEPRTPMWLPALGAALFVAAGLGWVLTPSAAPIVAEPADSASTPVAAAPPVALAPVASAGRPSAAAPNPMPGLAGHPPSGAPPGGPAADERLRRLREQMQLKGAGGHP